MQETHVANPPADASAVDTRIVSVLQTRQDAVGTAYLLENVRLGTAALGRDQAGNYYLYGEPFTCATTVDCDALFSLSGSDRETALRFAYTGVDSVPISLIDCR